MKLLQFDHHSIITKTNLQLQLSKQKKQMKSLSELTLNIHEWNKMGFSSLPYLQIAIIHSNKYNSLIEKFIHKILPSQQSRYLLSKVQSSVTNKKQHEKHIFLEKDLQNVIYVEYQIMGKIECKLHILIDQQQSDQINDDDLKRSKMIIQRLKRNKNVIFLNFYSSLYKLDVNFEHIELFGLGFKSKEKQIKVETHVKTYEFDQFKSEELMRILQKKYVRIYAANINKSYNQMKGIYKSLGGTVKKYEPLLKLKEKIQKYQSQQFSKSDCVQKQLISYSLKCLTEAKQFLISDLMGTFSNLLTYHNLSSKPTTAQFQHNNSIFSLNRHKRIGQLNRSTHWQIMQIMNEFWQIQSDTLMKCIDKMPISYIEEKYKMLDYESIGGFMPSSCFHAIFSPPLRKMVNQIIQTLKAIQFKILQRIQYNFQYFLANLNIAQQFSQSQYEKIESICQQFIKQTERTLNSQIEYINTSSEDFWAYKQLKSSIYGPEQQVYIEIKYIGKSYIKKVFENIKDTVPRLMGQNLLKEICVYLENQMVQDFIDLVKEKKLEIQINHEDVRELKRCKQNYEKIDKLIYFFSLKTDSTLSIRNYHDRVKKDWKRMYQHNNQQVQIVKDQDKNQKKGFLEWARNLFKSKPKSIQRVRSNSQDKQTKQSTKNQKIPGEYSNVLKKQHILTQKNWLLIINIGKKVERNKIQESAKQGFPSRLRPAIWLYLCKKNELTKINKIQSLFEEVKLFPASQKAQIDDICRQIDKDVLRTPPASLFRQGYLKQSLTNVLRAYAIEDKQLRYTQGMNFIVGIILCVLTHYGESADYLEENQRSKSFLEDIQNKALFILQFIMYEKGLRKIMFIERKTITDLCIRLENYVQKVSPLMNEKISRSGFTVEMIFSGALISALTTSEITYDLQKRVLDVLITLEFSILYKIIGQFIGAAENLCLNLENENLYYFLRGKFYNQVYKQIGDEGLNRMFKSL